MIVSVTICIDLHIWPIQDTCNVARANSLFLFLLCLCFHCFYSYCPNSVVSILTVQIPTKIQSYCPNSDKNSVLPILSCYIYVQPKYIYFEFSVCTKIPSILCSTNEILVLL